MAMSVRPETLLFDLGGVIVPWVGIEALMAQFDMTRAQVTDRFAASDVFNQYEAGQCSDAAFIEEFAQIFPLDIAPSEIPALWNSWVHPPFPRTEDVLRALAKDYRISCLSNTNALHWGRVKSVLDLGLFDPPFASHEIHAAKPARESYDIPLARLGASDPAAVWFFDDTEINVIASREAGMTAFLVDRAVGVIPTLEKLRLI